jgi:hypothetical protein
MFEKLFLGTFLIGNGCPSLNRVGGFSSDGNEELSKFLKPFYAFSLMYE